MVKKRAPDGVSQAATRGFRLASHASFVGSILPGLNLRVYTGVSGCSGSVYLCAAQNSNRDIAQHVREGELAVSTDFGRGGVQCAASRGARDEAELRAVEPM